MSWFDLDVDGFRYISNFTKSETQAVVVHARLDETSKITVESTTDWGLILIGVGSLISTLVMGFFTYKSQKQQIQVNAEGLKNQVRSNAAGLRNEWMEQLRAATSEFLQCAALVTTGLQEDNREDEYNAQLTVMKHRALYLQVRIKLYVGVTSDNAKDINDVAEWIVKDLDRLIDGDVRVQDVYDRLTELEELVVYELERAWNQIKADLGLPNNLGKSATSS